MFLYSKKLIIYEKKVLVKKEKKGGVVMWTNKLNRKKNYMFRLYKNNIILPKLVIYACNIPQTMNEPMPNFLEVELLDH